MQALSEHTSESALGDWIKELLGALDDAAKTNEAISGAYNLNPGEDAGVLAEAEKIPSRSERTIYLTSCWLETLCTAEARVLGWIYQQLYGRHSPPRRYELRGGARAMISLPNPSSQFGLSTRSL